MRLNVHAANSIVSTLASLRVALVLGGVLLLTETVVLATTLFAAAFVSFVASLLIAARIYRNRGQHPAHAQAVGVANNAAVR